MYCYKNTLYIKTQKFFKAYSRKKTMAYEKIRAARSVNDPAVHDLWSLRYNPPEIVEFKTDFDAVYKALPRRRKQISNITEFSPFHKTPLKIQESKRNHLQKLKVHIPAVCRTYYDSLPFRK